MNSPTESGLLNTGINESLAPLLSRLASLQGHAVPWHRFAMLSHGVNGAALKDLPVASVAAECWRARFPAGEIKLAEMPLNRGDAPALWLGPEQPGSAPQAYIVRGSLSSGALSCLDDKGRAVELPQAQAVLGQVLVLRADEPLDSTVTDGMSAAPRSAAAWFRYAILKRRRVFIEAAVATLTVNFIGLASSFYSMQVYDRVIPTGGYPTLWVMTIGVLLAMVIELAMRMVRARLVERNCKAIDEELSGVFFGHALAIRMDQRPRTVGTFAAQIRHFEMVRNFMTSTTLFVMADAPFALLFVIVIALIAGPVALVPLLFVPVAIFAGLAFRKPLARLSENHMQESNRKNGLLIEVIDGIESVKAASGEWKMLDRWLDLTRTLGRNEIAIKDITSLSTNLTQSLQQLSYVGLIAAGAYAIGAGYLTVGGLIACTIISGRALSPIAQISGLIVQWQQARVALKGLDSIMALPTDSQPGERRFVPDRCDGRLRLDSLKFAYGPDMSALTVDALSVKPGERVAVLGTVGSGKSTLVKLLSGLYRPQEGRVFLDDVDVTHLAPEFVREHIGYLPQDVRLFQGTLRENLALGLPSPTDDQILTAARMTGLDRLLLTHPKGLGIEISEGGRGLSGGQRQLVGLTRLVLAQPRVMLLDEPTASMDPQLEEFVAERVFGHRPQDTTLVVVTHKVSMLRHFTRIVIVERGRIIMDGPRDEILQRLRKGPQTQPPAQAVAQAASTPTSSATIAS